MEKNYNDKIKEDYFKQNLELIELKSEYKSSKKAIKRDLSNYCNILITILSALVAIFNVLFGCPCNLKVDDTMLLIFNIINIFIIGSSCFLKVSNFILSYVEDNKKSANKKGGNAVNEDTNLSDVKEIYIDERNETSILELKNYYEKEISSLNKIRKRFLLIFTIWSLIIVFGNAVMLVLGFCI